MNTTSKIVGARMRADAAVVNQMCLTLVVSLVKNIAFVVPEETERNEEREREAWIYVRRERVAGVKMLVWFTHGKMSGFDFYAKSLHFFECFVLTRSIYAQ